jgi:hypothetical protein
MAAELYRRDVGFLFRPMDSVIGIIGSIGLAMTFFSSPVWLVYWWFRFGRIKTADVDYSCAGRNWTTAFLLWFSMFVIFLAQMLLLRAR